MTKAAIIFLVCMLSIEQFGFSQTHKIDSLKKICYSNKSNEERIEAFLQLLRQKVSMSSKDFSTILFDAGILISKSTNASALCRYAYSKGRYYEEIGQIDSASAIYVETINKYKTNNEASKDLLWLEFAINGLLINEGKYKEAIAAQLTLMKKAEAQKEMKIWCYGCNQIGFCYMDMGRYEEAISWFKKVIDMPLEPSQQFDKSSIINNTSSCLNNVSKYEEALNLINKGIEKAKEYENLTALANGLNIKADILLNLQQKDKVEPMLLEAIEIRKRIGNYDFVASDMAQLALYYGNSGQYDKGIDLANQALKIYEQNRLIPKFMFAYEALKVNYKNKGDLKNYASVLEKMLSLKDSLYTRNSAEELTALQTKYEVEKKEALIAKQKLDLFKQNLFLYGGIIVTVLVLLFLAYRFNKYKQQQKKELAAIMEEEKRQNEMAMKASEEKERKRIAADLHDNLGVQANAILHNSTLLIEDDVNNKHVVADLQETAKEMMLNLRETLWAMKSTDVPAADLWLRIISFMKQMGRHYTSLKFVVQGEVPTDIIIPSNKALNIILILQEAVNNAVKHANATEIIAKSIHKTSGWQIIVTDNGKGFDTTAKANLKGDGYGLDNMQERATAFAIGLSISSEVAKGTKIELSI